LNTSLFSHLIERFKTGQLNSLSPAFNMGFTLSTFTNGSKAHDESLSGVSTCVDVFGWQPITTILMKTNSVTGQPYIFCFIGVYSIFTFKL
jgi:hypothetical protein